MAVLSRRTLEAGKNDDTKYDFRAGVNLHLGFCRGKVKEH
jgi:hypothetical protein